MSATLAMNVTNRVTQVENEDSRWRGLYRVAGVAALVALITNVLDVVLGFGGTELPVFGGQSAMDWFALYQDNGFKGLYMLGLFNIVYMACLFPIVFALFGAHRRTYAMYAALAMIISFIGMAIYIANNAAIPMFVLANKYAAAGTETQRALYVAAGEAVLAAGEDFTPGAFTGLILGGIANIAVSFVMLRGGVFRKAAGWIGIVGFTSLSIFTIWATFIPILYGVAFYLFGMIGGLLALAWFILVSLEFFRLGRTQDVAQ